MPTWRYYPKGFYKGCIKSSYIGLGFEIIYGGNCKEFEICIRFFKWRLGIGYRFKERTEYDEMGNLVFTEMED